MDTNTLFAAVSSLITAMIMLALLIERTKYKRRAEELEKELEDLRSGGAAPWANPPVSQMGSVAANASDFMVEVERLVRANQLIQAIKLYREKTGMGLKESKDAIDALKRQLNL